MRQLLVFILITMAFAASAAIYVNQNANGTTEYTDTPNEHSKKIAVPPVNTTSSVTPEILTAPAPATSASTTGAGATDAAAGAPVLPPGAASTNATYKVFDIETPKNGETIQNQPVLGVQVKVEPTMVAGDKVQLFLDGKPAGTPNASIYQELVDVERGTHTVAAAIVNIQNQIIKQSKTITFYVHRNSAVTSPAMQAAPPPPRVNPPGG